MVRRLVAMALLGLLVSGCEGFPFLTEKYEPGTVVGRKTAVVANGRIPYNGAFLPIEMPDGSVVPVNKKVDKHGREYEEIDLRELDQISKETASNPVNPSATRQAVGNSPAEMSGGPR
jgi:hypothetical protein